MVADRPESKPGWVERRKGDRRREPRFETQLWVGIPEAEGEAEDGETSDEGAVDALDAALAQEMAASDEVPAEDGSLPAPEKKVNGEPAPEGGETAEGSEDEE